MFLDLNSYFASVHQAEDPALRGRPVGVAAVMADTSFLIAASYEAKAFGVKTGTRIGDAKRMCPDLQLITSTHGIYSDYHQRILEAVETVLPVEAVLSIDEMQFRLIGIEQQPSEAERIAHRMKKAIWDLVSPHMNCSIGVAPNGFLAKLATEMQKPNGLVLLPASDLPGRLADLKLTDFTGINRRMAARLNARGVFSGQDLIDRNVEELRQAFGSVWGERWWYLLRGYEVMSPHRENQSLGHSHVLPPQMRTDKGCHDVLLRLLQKASARLRSVGLFANGMHVSVSGNPGWEANTRLAGTNDSVKMTQEFLRLWKGRSFERPMKVGVTFYDLHVRTEVTGSLFDEPREDHAHLNTAIDELNQKFGKNTIYLAGIHAAKDTAQERIAFQKTELFNEGPKKPTKPPKAKFRRA